MLRPGEIWGEQSIKFYMDGYIRVIFNGVMSHRGNLDTNPVVVRVVVRSSGGARAKVSGGSAQGCNTLIWNCQPLICSGQFLQF